MEDIMAKAFNSGKEWTNFEIQRLIQLAKQNHDTDFIAAQLGRTVSAIYNKASELGITLKPKDKNNRH
jgi:hypothetical protein